MHILQLGASGRTGIQVLSRALVKGHEVTALVRRPSSLPPRKNLTILSGSPLDVSALSECFTSGTSPVDAVIITLAVPRASDSPFAKPTAAPYLIRDAVRNVLAVMKQHGVSRLVVMSAFGTGDSFAQLGWPFKLLFRWSNMSCVLQDHDAVDAEVREAGAGMEWTLVKPPMLKDGEARPVREFGEAGKGIQWLDTATRASVADVLVQAIEEGKWKRQAVVVAN